MASLPISQLSALASGIDDLAQRAAGMADDLNATDEAEAASAMFEVERSLLMAHRSVDRARRALEH